MGVVCPKCFEKHDLNAGCGVIVPIETWVEASERLIAAGEKSKEDLPKLRKAVPMPHGPDTDGTLSIGYALIDGCRCKCGHEWRPRDLSKSPGYCPKCKSRKWSER